MAESQNGWPVLPYGDRRLHRWVIPARNGRVELTLRYGSAGFLLAHYLTWHSETIEDLTGAHPQDDWGHAVRDVRGSDDISNHASGTAADANATRHPLGVKGTLSSAELAKIRLRMGLYAGTLRHGALYQGRVDAMHVEINAPLVRAERMAKILAKSPRGKRVLEANPGQLAIIRS